MLLGALVDRLSLFVGAIPHRYEEEALKGRMVEAFHLRDATRCEALVALARHEGNLYMHRYL